MRQTYYVQNFCPFTTLDHTEGELEKEIEGVANVAPVENTGKIPSNGFAPTPVKFFSKSTDVEDGFYTSMQSGHLQKVIF